MPSVVHLVTTDNFAGVERYVCSTGTELTRRGWDVTIVGGHPRRVREALAADAAWLPGATPVEALRSLAKLPRQDVCHAHMTIAEAVAVASRPVHGGVVVSTRHFAAPRGSTVIRRMLAPLIAAKLDRQIAVSDFVAAGIERPADAVLKNGISLSPLLWQRSNRFVLVLQRLEREKDTLTALRGWQKARMFEEGWSLRIVGDGAERKKLEAWVMANHVPGVVFTGWSSDVSSEFARAGILLAPAPAEPFGLAVVEAMSAGVPVVACAAGGHLETVGLLSRAALFPPAEHKTAAELLRSLLDEETRCALSAAGRDLASREFSLARHVARLTVQYQRALTQRRK